MAFDIGEMQELAVMRSWNGVYMPVNDIITVVLVFSFDNTVCGRYRSSFGFLVWCYLDDTGGKISLIKQLDTFPSPSSWTISYPPQSQAMYYVPNDLLDAARPVVAEAKRDTHHNDVV
jgi:hypothetical protein